MVSGCGTLFPCIKLLGATWTARNPWGVAPNPTLAARQAGQVLRPCGPTPCPALPGAYCRPTRVKWRSSPGPRCAALPGAAACGPALDTLRTAEPLPAALDRGAPTATRPPWTLRHREANSPDREPWRWRVEQIRASWKVAHHWAWNCVLHPGQPCE